MGESLHRFAVPLPLTREVLVLFREKAGEFGIIGEGKSVGFFSHNLIKLRIGCFNIGLEENFANAAAENPEDSPADEGKIENKDLPFFAVGHFFGKFKGALGRNLRVFRKDIGNH